MRAISTYYQRHPEASQRSVLEVAFEVSKAGVTPHVASGGESWRERHGYFDGEYWRQSDDSERQAFVSGYLACRAKYLHLTTDVPMAVIVSNISKWYQINPEDVSDIDPLRSNDKIGDLLDRILKEKHRR